jgi:hypothetical protein
MYLYNRRIHTACQYKKHRQKAMLEYVNNKGLNIKTMHPESSHVRQHLSDKTPHRQEKAVYSTGLRPV